MRAKISEIFKSIQGEGIYFGREQVFVRFFGCNLNCSFCDTKFFHFKDIELEDVLREINNYKMISSIAITGGEPLIQKDFLKEFFPLLKNENKEVYLETNGVLPEVLKEKEIINNVDIISMDIKLPSSTRQKSYYTEHKEFLSLAVKKNVFVKTVITLDTSLDDFVSALRLVKSFDCNIPFVIQPAYQYQSMLENKLIYFYGIATDYLKDVRVLPQMHKILGIK